MLRQYFARLERLFAQCAITSDVEKKFYSVSFLDSDLADSWEALPEYSNPDKSYSDYKKRLFELYYQDNLRYTLSDLDQLVGERQRLGTSSPRDLTEFHLRFNAISTHLLKYQLLSLREQSALYMRAFPETIRAQVDLRLHIQYPDHSPSLPHSIDSIFEATRWVLQDPTYPNLFSTPSNDSTSTIDSNATPVLDTSISTYYSNSVISEQLSAILEDASTTIMTAIHNSDLSESSHNSMQATDSMQAIPSNIPASSSITPALLLTNATSTFIPEDPIAIQARIDAIEDELRILRTQVAQCDVSTTLDDPIRSSIMPTQSATSCDRSSNIISPATFVYQNKVHQAIYKPRQPAIPATPVDSPSTTSISEDPTASNPVPTISTHAISNATHINAISTNSADSTAPATNSIDSTATSTVSMNSTVTSSTDLTSISTTSATDYTSTSTINHSIVIQQSPRIAFDLFQNLDDSKDFVSARTLVEILRVSFEHTFKAFNKYCDHFRLSDTFDEVSYGFFDRFYAIFTNFGQHHFDSAVYRSNIWLIHPSRPPDLAHSILYQIDQQNQPYSPVSALDVSLHTASLRTSSISLRRPSNKVYELLSQHLEDDQNSIIDQNSIDRTNLKLHRKTSRSLDNTSNLRSLHFYHVLSFAQSLNILIWYQLVMTEDSQYFSKEEMIGLHQLQAPIFAFQLSLRSTFTIIIECERLSSSANDCDAMRPRVNLDYSIPFQF
jgi:hypothetical protein